MEKDNVVDIKTGRVLFTDEVRGKLADGLLPFIRQDSSAYERERAVTTVEQVLCTAIISAAVGLAVKLAAKIAGKITD